MDVVVFGAGSWGTALTLILARNGHNVFLADHTEHDAALLRSDRENKRYLPGFEFPENINILGPNDDVPVCAFSVLAIPTAFVRSNLTRFEGQSVVCVASKGLDPETGGTLSQVVSEGVPGVKVVSLSGPNLAVELARGIPTAAVSASHDEAAADLVRNAFMGPTYRVYLSQDPLGVELAGALKNVIAIGAGISDGMGFGDNTKGAFLARGLGEMTKLGMALGARMETFLGLAGVGDLFATAASKLSRNYRVGFALGQGMSLDEAVASLGQVAEGVPTCKVALRLAAEKGVDVPLMTTLYEVMHAEIEVGEALTRLMERRTPTELN
ncbi:MAG: NAD(P)H-dependent glycerol-3-phosphate dehydrogenase [Fimbriimonadaceae bacterium]